MSCYMDLHIHSCYSEDGEYPPSALVQMCADAGIQMMAIADHNCVRGVPEAMARAGRLHIRCYPAIEIDCAHRDIDLHILGYNIAWESPDFVRIEENVRRQCAASSRERLDLVNQLGFALEAEAVRAIAAQGTWEEYWTGEIIAEALLGDERYRHSALLRPYRTGGGRDDNPYVNFYWDYCAQGKPCFVGMVYPGLEEVLDIIHRNGGEAVIAHPGKNLTGRFEMMDELISLGLDGIEAYSSYHDGDTEEWFLNKARRHGLVATRGSDFHGKTKPAIRLGA